MAEFDRPPLLFEEVAARSLLSLGKTSSSLASDVSWAWTYLLHRSTGAPSRRSSTHRGLSGCAFAVSLA